MKRIYLMALVAISIVISGCDNQAKQRELEEQRHEDSIRVAENVKKELAEKEAKERAEREEQEAKERAEREKQEAQERAEREAKTWTGASSESELRQKLNGTSWYINQGGLKRKLVFSNGTLTMYSSTYEDVDSEGHYYNSYEIKSKEGYLFVFFGLDEEHMGDRDFGICFTDSKAIFTQFGKPIGQLTFMGR
jgi:outer membrane murein-binding lipoprotein Lpp